uniref:ShKT domain-containing protein n=1 Tax=Setaria digitata TaxID=48799 RepID=A0A915PZ25_9BILA
MRYTLDHCLLLLALLIISTADNGQKFKITCADKSLQCKRRSHLCQSNAFRTVMQSLCKKTCNLCEDSREDEVVEMDENEEETDIENEKETESTDYSELERSTTEMEEVTEESTTVKPSTFITYSTSKSWKQAVCMDSSSDCEGKKRLCSEQTYAHLMRRECRKTCGLCQPTNTYSFSGSNRLPARIPSGEAKSGMNIWECQDMASDCRESLCNRRSYQQLMQTICKKTCSLC